MTKPAIVVIGPGLMGLKHIQMIQDHPHCALAGIVTPRHGTSRDIGERYPDTPIFDDLEACIAAGTPDGVIISSPNEFHYEQAKLCIERRIPVLIEKPITPHHAEAAHLVELAERHGAKVLVGHHRVHSPLLTTAKAVIDSGRLGRLVALQGSAIFYKPADYFAAGPWRTQPGGGPILINLIHEIGIMRTLCGEIAAVQAIASNRVRGFAVEDTVAINLQFRSGALGTFILSDTGASPHSWEQTSRENPVYPSYPDADCYSVTGTLGSLEFPTMRLRTHPTPQAASWHVPMEEEVVPVTREDPLARQLENLLDVIRGVAAPIVPAFDGAQNVRVAAAIHRSAETRTLVELDA